jgi:hypothetical protein
MWASEEARRRGDRRAGTDHLLLGLLEEPEIEAVLGVSLPEARVRLDSLDREALVALGVAQGIDAPPLQMHPVPKKPTIKAVVQDRIRMTNTSLLSKYSCGFSIWNHLTPPRYCWMHLAWIRLRYEVDLSKQTRSD